MSQRTRILTQIVGYRGWKVTESRWEARDGTTIQPVAGYEVPLDARLVVVLQRRWAARCAKCLAISSTRHEKGKVRRWMELPACGRPVIIEYAPDHVRRRQLRLVRQRLPDARAVAVRLRPHGD